MDALVQAALLGTARQDAGGIETGTPVDTLVAALPDEMIERRLLLQAGAWAAYRQAGWVAEQAPPLPEPAPEEMLQGCSAGATRLIDEMLKGEHAELLPEALERLRRAGQRLPARLLPQALEIEAALRPAMLPVLGARGRWLARLNPRWRWVSGIPVDGDGGLPDNAEDVWQEGTPEQRLEILRRVRAANPTQGRGWLEAVWMQEKADVRKDLIEILEIGLSPDDEPFLEAALDDRGASVRKAAAALLARLPGSTLSQRMLERADPLLSYTSPGGLKKRAKTVSGGSAKAGTLAVTPPEAADKEWARDGIDLKAPQGMGQRAWWLLQILSFVPPRHWTERFEAGPSELISAAQRVEWNSAVLEGWTNGAIAHRDAGWALPLWERWVRDKSSGSGGSYRIGQLRAALAPLIPQADAERLAGHMFTDKIHVSSRDSWIEALDLLPRPWSPQFGTIYLRAMRRYVEESESARQTSYAWQQTLAVAATSLPPVCFTQALEPWPIPESDNWHAQEWRRQIHRLTETIQIRQRLMEEIPL